MSGLKQITREADEREAIRRMDEYLKGYAFNRRLLRLARYEKEYFGERDAQDGELGEPMARARMFAIRHFIMELPNGNEKLFLYYHYIRAESVERCAELLGIARSSGFRLKKRALLRAAYAWEDTQKTEEA